MTSRTWLAVAVLATGGCAGGGGLGDILGGVLGGQQQGTGGGSETVSAEVQQVDTRNQVIGIRTEDGQSVDIRFDQNTRVVYRQQEYPVTALEYGDLVRMEIREVGQNEYYASLVEVEQSAQDRGIASGGTGSTQLSQLSGRVDLIDSSNGLFTLRTSNNQVVTVAMPYNASAADRDRFQRLRRGDDVRVQGRFTSQDRMELVRFY